MFYSIHVLFLPDLSSLKYHIMLSVKLLKIRAIITAESCCEAEINGNY